MTTNYKNKTKKHLEKTRKIYMLRKDTEGRKEGNVRKKKLK